MFSSILLYTVLVCFVLFYCPFFVFYPILFWSAMFCLTMLAGILRSMCSNLLLHAPPTSLCSLFHCFFLFYFILFYEFLLLSALRLPRCSPLLERISIWKTWEQVWRNLITPNAVRFENVPVNVIPFIAWCKSMRSISDLNGFPSCSRESMPLLLPSFPCCHAIGPRPRRGRFTNSII